MIYNIIVTADKNLDEILDYLSDGHSENYSFNGFYVEKSDASVIKSMRSIVERIDVIYKIDAPEDKIMLMVLKSKIKLVEVDKDFTAT